MTKNWVQNYPILTKILTCTPLSLITLGVAIGPHVSRNPAAILLFCGGWANFEAFRAIWKSLIGQSDQRVRARLLIELCIFALILGYDANKLFPLWAVFLLVVILFFVTSKKLFTFISTRAERNGQEAFISTRAERNGQEAFFWLSLFGGGSLPFILSLIPLFIPSPRPFIFQHFPIEYGWAIWFIRYFYNALGEFIRVRFDAYVHLLIIPIIYLGFDLWNRTVKNAVDSVKLDVVTLAVGLSCASCGWAWYRCHAAPIVGDDGLFESGAAAAVLLLSNWVFLLYIDRNNHETSGTERKVLDGANGD